MSYQFPELRVCGGPPAHWKVKHVATDNYPAFVQGLSCKDMAHLLKPAPSTLPTHKIPTGGDPAPDHETESNMVLILDLSPSSCMKRQAQTHRMALPATQTAAKRQRHTHGAPTATTSTLSTKLLDPLYIFCPVSHNHLTCMAS